FLTAPQELAVCSNHVGRDEVVAGEAVLAVEPAEAAPQREARYPGHRDDPERGRQPESLRLVVELAQREPGLGFGATLSRIDADAFHGRKVEHPRTFAYRLASDAVAPATDRERQIVACGEPDPTPHP